jgi:hypothetical protein
VRYLLDECLSDRTAKAMAVVGAPDEFVHILDVAPPSTSDLDIPAICRDKSFGTLITVNVKDFGARKHIYEAVVDAGTNVLVLRRQKRQATTYYWQVSLLARHYLAYQRLFETATEATLGSLSDGGVRAVTLAQIMAEIADEDAGKRQMP